MTIQNYHLSGKLTHHFFSQSLKYSFLMHSVTALSMDLPGQLHIMWHNCDPPYVYSTQVGVLK